MLETKLRRTCEVHACSRILGPAAGSSTVGRQKGPGRLPITLMARTAFHFKRRLLHAAHYMASECNVRSLPTHDGPSLYTHSCTRPDERQSQQGGYRRAKSIALRRKWEETEPGKHDGEAQVRMRHEVCPRVCLRSEQLPSRPPGREEAGRNTNRFTATC